MEMNQFKPHLDVALLPLLCNCVSFARRRWRIFCTVLLLVCIPCKPPVLDPFRPTRRPDVSQHGTLLYIARLLLAVPVLDNCHKVGAISGNSILQVTSCFPDFICVVLRFQQRRLRRNSILP